MNLACVHAWAKKALQLRTRKLSGKCLQNLNSLSFLGTIINTVDRFTRNYKLSNAVVDFDTALKHRGAFQGV